MMSWINIVVTILGLTSVGSLSVFIFYRQNKANATSNVTDKLLGNIVKQNDVFKGLLDSKDKTISQLYSIITQKDTMIQDSINHITQLKKESVERNYQISKITRQIKGVQEQMNIDKNKMICLDKRVQFAEKNICFVENCNLRKPSIGTYTYEEQKDS